MMVIQGKWSAHSSSEKNDEGEKLVNMAGQWNIGIEVNVTTPYVFTPGAIEETEMADEVPTPK